MNEVWFEWVGEFPEQKGVRACVEAAMARPKLLVEIKVIAAVP
jgi:enamine deaminase RidA (YjgF/YER057c/UK114 family)